MGRWIFSFFLICFSSSLYCASESDILRRIASHLIIGDVNSAINEAEAGLSEYPESLPLLMIKVKAYAQSQDEKPLLGAWQSLEIASKEKAYSSQVLEEVCWAILKKGSETSALNIRLISLIAAAITHDVKAVPLLYQALCDRSAPIRGVAVSLASHYRDEVLKDKILTLFNAEKNGEVRAKLAAAFSEMELKEKIPLLLQRLLDPACDAEEQVTLILSIATLQESIEHSTLKTLATSVHAVLRLLAAEGISQLHLKESGDLLFPLLLDRNSDVRASAIKGVGLLKIKELNGHPTTSSILQAAECGDIVVKITAGWALLIMEEEEGERILERFLQDGRGSVRTTAAAALVAAGPYGLKLAKKWIDFSKDPFVKANLAIALIQNREDVEKASSAINGLFRESEEKWMWKEEVQGLFQVLQKSDLKHNALIPNFPEVASQAVHLELLNLLAIVEDPMALTTIKDYLLKKQWQITGIAAEMLLGEGDESVIELIRQLLDNPSQEVRLEAALTLAMWGKDASAAKTLMELYPTSDRMKKIKILEAIGRIGDKAALPFLAKELHNSSQMLRIVAAACILMTINH